MPDPWGYTDPNNLWANDNNGRWQNYYEQFSPDSQFYTGQDNQQYSNPNYNPGNDTSGDTQPVDSPQGIYKGIDINSLPDWLKPYTMHHAVNELKDEYRGVKKSYNVKDEIDKYLNAANSGYAMQLQQGNNVASETAARAYQSGIPGQVNSGAIAAQFALPALQGRVDAEAKAAGIKTTAAQAASQARSALAQAISGARNAYANTLATYRQQNIGQNEFQQTLAQNNSQFQQKLAFDKEQLTAGGGVAGARSVADIVRALTQAQTAAPETLTDIQGKGVDPLNENYAEYRRKLMERLLAITGSATQGTGQ